MKKFTSILLITIALFMFDSCKKAEDVTPKEDPTEDPGGNGNGNTTEANVLDLKQNFAKADGVVVEKLDFTSVELLGEGDDQFHKLSAFGANSTWIEIYLKGNEPKAGNYTLKKWRLGSNPSETEVVIRIGIAGTLLDFESSDSKNFSIIKNAEGFFVIKMAPLVGIKKNSWDDELTAPISVHIVSNSKKIVASENSVSVENIQKYGFTHGKHLESAQAFASVWYSDGKGPAHDIQVKFYGYDYSGTSVANKTIALSKEAFSVAQTIQGTVAKGVHFSSGTLKYYQDYSLNQEVQIELKANYIIVKYTDIKMVNKNDATDSFSVTGEVMIAR